MMPGPEHLIIAPILIPFVTGAVMLVILVAIASELTL